VPLQHDAVQEKVVRNKFVNLTFHPQRMTETNAGVRRPWLGGSFVEVRNQCERGDGDREEEGEKWRWCEKC
jgi:hypothetical protein